MTPTIQSEKRWRLSSRSWLATVRRSWDGSRFPAGITSTITSALVSPDATDEQVLHADEIAFHLTDWNSDAAFIVALHLFPERFTPEEVNAAVGMFLIHVPSHVVAAARLAGYPAEDLFKEDKAKDLSVVELTQGVNNKDTK